MMLSFLKRVTQLFMLLIVMSVFGVIKVRAQSITPAQDGTGTNVTTNGNQYDIDGGSLSGDGANLFHSFEQFGLSQEEIANFSSNPNLVNILGRIRGGDPSMINGLIQMTGGDSHLFLMNPAGFVFGDSAALNVPGNFTVTTANGIQFGSGWFNATGANDYQGLVGNPTGLGFTMAQPGAIVNEGNLAVGAGRDLSLVGGAVVNTGELQAPGGGVVVSAVPGENLVRLSIPGNVLSLEVEPLGGSQPNGWNLPITALPDLLTVGASGVQGNSDGTVQVAGVQVPGDAGTAIVSGEVDVSGEMGGNVGVFGDKVAVVGAEIDVSGVKGGGKVWLGGDYKGEGNVPNAQRTLVDGNSVINADAGVNGDGGEVIVWAEEATVFDGSISARGGSESGNGGFAEVSGKNFLDFQGNVDTQAPKGQSGTLLLDPTNINVVAGAGNTSDTTIFFDDLSADTQVSESSISNATSNVILQATNNITFSVPINMTASGVGLTAEANNDIVINVGITTNGGNLTFSTGSTVDVNANITTTGGDININSGGMIDTTGGTLNSSSSGNGGAITLTAPNGNINTGDLFSFSQLSGNTTAGNGGGITLNAGGDINGDILNSSSTLVLGDGNTGNGGTIFLEAGGEIQVTEVDTRSQIIASSQVTNRTAGNGGEITLEAGNDITVIDRLLSFSRIGITDGDGTAGNGGAISLTAGGNINIPGADFGGTSQPIYSESRVSGNGTAGNGGAITLTAEGGITINGVPETILGANAIRAGSVVGGDGIASNGGAIKFETQSGDINIDVLEGAIESAAVVVGEGTAGDGGTITFDSGGNIDVANPVISGTGVGTGTAGDAGAITFTASGNITTGVDTNISGVTLYGVDARGLSGGSGGAISITSQNGSINTSAGTVNSRSVAGTGGAISLSAANDSAIATIATTNNNVDVDAPLNLTNDTSIEIDGTGGNVNFNDTVDGNPNLTVNSGSGDTNFNAPVGNTQPLENLQVNSTGTTRFNDTVQSVSLTTDTGGETQINDDVTTTGTNGQNYGDNVRIDDNLTLDSNNHPITVNGTLNSQTGENNDLTANAGTGNITVNSQVGNSQPLGNLEFNTTGNTQINSTVQSTSLTTDTGGETQINGNVTTTGLNGQNYNDNVRIDNNLTLDSNDNPININGTVNSQSGETNSLTINSGNSNTSLNADVGNTSPLGDVNINSTNDINTQNLTASTINLTSENNVNTGNLDTSSTTENGGDISLEGTTVTTENLNSSGINGGNISIEATTSIETGTINSSGTSGNGGDVTLDPENDIEVSSINAQGGANGVGGNVDITTEQNFRATETFTDQNGIEASISTAGGQEGGSVTIRHGGGSQNIPFVVGDATTNGTAAAITTGADNTIAPVQSFPGSHTQGTPPNEIQIITQDQPTNGSEDFEQPTAQLPQPTTPRLEVEQIVEELEEGFTRQVESYYGRQGETPVKTLDDIRNELLQVENQTGVKPAIIYAFFFSKDISDEELKNLLQRINGEDNQAVSTPEEKEKKEEKEETLEWQFSADSTASEYSTIQKFLPKEKDNKDKLFLLMVTGHTKPILKPVSGATREQVIKQAGRENGNDGFRGAVKIPREGQFRPQDFELAQQFHQWLIQPLEDTFIEQDIDNLVFIPDTKLRSLPFAAIHDGQDYIIKNYSIGLMPSMSLTNTRYVDIKNAQTLAMGTGDFTDEPNLQNLPTVPEQLKNIQEIRPAGSVKLLEDEAFTIENLKSELEQIPFRIVHLATHGKFNSDITNSYIQFWKNRLGLKDIRQVQFDKPPVDLLVLSACETALGNEKAELGFAGFASQAKAKSVLASLSRVDEQATLKLMTEFYKELQTAPIKAEALRQAQLTLLNGEMNDEMKPDKLSHPYNWAWFTIVGSPW